MAKERGERIHFMAGHHERFRYTVFFLFMATMTAGGAKNAGSFVLAWLALSLLVMAVAYGANKPFLVCGKRPSGQISIVLLILNLPWLMPTWVIWLLVALCSREASVNQIDGTNISISRYPLFAVDLSRFDRIIDLTAEFPLAYKASAAYECLANLDGIQLRHIRARPISAEQTVLVHCAQGHGRSATFVALLLRQLGVFSSTESAYRAIQRVRPGAVVAVSQRLQMDEG